MTDAPAIARVIEKQFCIGCGACAAVDPAFVVERAANGENRVLTVPGDPAALARGDRVCPFATAPDEDELAEAAFPEAAHRHDGIGRWEALYAGWAQETRADAGSGGLTRWLMAELLRRGEVDFVVHVETRTTREEGEDLFGYTVHSDPQSYLAATATSAYYPVTLAALFDLVAERPGRCAVTALPCFARAIRALTRERPELSGKIRFVSGVICGSLKSRRYAEYLGEQMGVPTRRLGRIDFRAKSLSRRATEKCVAVWSRGSPGGPDVTKRVQDLDGTKYDMGYFKYKACDYCDDVLAETADIAFGDAWLPQYSGDPRGANVVVVRDRALADLLAEAARAGVVRLDPLTEDEVARSQGGGLRHRRDGLAVRLAVARLFGRWTPRKRVSPRLGGPTGLVTQAKRVSIRAVTRAPGLPPGSRRFRAAVGAVLRGADLLERGLAGARRVARRG